MSVLGLILASLVSVAPVDGFLREELRFTSDDFTRLRAGEPVGKLLPSRVPGELALGGAIRLSVSRETYLRWYRDPRNWTLTLDEKRPAIIDAGLLGRPPAREDFARLGLEPNDALRDSWWRAACAISPIGDDQLLYWTRERYGFGLATTAALYEATISGEAGGITRITTRLLRATHYFDSSVSVTMLADTPGGGCILAYVNRSQIDALRRGWGARFRWIVNMAVPRGARRELRSLAARVQAFK